MADHASGPRAIADPVIDISDMYVFPAPGQPDRLVLVLNVFPFAGPSACFSDAVDYRFRLRPLRIAGTGMSARFDVAATEHVINCHFTTVGDDAPIRQTCTCVTSFGPTLSVAVGDDDAAGTAGVRVFAGQRSDPFFFDGVRAAQTVATGKNCFAEVGETLTAHQNVLSVIVQIDTEPLTRDGEGPLFGVVGETLARGGIATRLERFGRIEIKNVVLSAKHYDEVNRDLEIRDLYNQEDAFNLAPTYLGAYRARMNANLAFWDRLDGAIAWPPDADGTHPLTELLLADFMVVDVSKPYAEDSTLEIERAMLEDRPHASCGGRSPNDDSVDSFLTLLVNAGHGPRISDGVDGAPIPAGHAFPYLLAPEPDPKPLVLPDLTEL